ncbi:hypothetical protein QFC22_000944 [Naganishia vaughanmartiniae]|uniref:Uncharacterized protein n=1 Tax=Naganishia vaughanmartiniae TaxID=1424756 RepID=A0ACC2XJL0_9TREE|nr:hypothetical protein QFC22_000944 [Naganishia vaughanmartiniae]
MLAPSVVSQAGPVLLETAIKHYLMRKKVTKDTKARGDFMYDEAFVLIKFFLETSTKCISLRGIRETPANLIVELSFRHTVEELQKFGLTRTPSPPWVLTHRVLVPINPCCSDAADYIIQALGGPENAFKLCGGTKWWTVRFQAGVEGEWIGIKKDWKKEEERVRKEEEARKKGSKISKGKEKLKESVQGSADKTDTQHDGIEGEFTPEMDHLRCMMYIPGGAHYWGSVNTHRYTIWRYARKMRGRCFAVNYRKAPQFPYPCAIQDCLAAYLYLIRPPPNAKHRPVDPKNLILAGDSAGGNLVLALLQIIRDTGLPAPAGAVLISPWSDLTHSFPSVMQNTATDIIPPYGFIHKPSTLWPPPAPELTETVQRTLRSKVKDTVNRLTGHQKPPISEKNQAGSSRSEDTATAVTTEPLPSEETTARGDTKIEPIKDGKYDATLHPASEGRASHHPGPTELGENHSVADPGDQKHLIQLDIAGKPVTIRSQIQLYATNDQLSQPLVSPVMGYLGGLPPLLVIASDAEVLRDEILYVAHKAAHPDQFPLKESIKEMMPSLRDIEGKHGPTQVHLQVYDHTCHVLPMISMSEPAKHCYRAIANFCRYATKEHKSGRNSMSSSQKQGIDTVRTSSFAMSELSTRTDPSGSVPASLFDSVNPPSIAPLTLAEPISVGPSISIKNHYPADKVPKSKPSFSKTFSFLSTSRRMKGAKEDSRPSSTAASDAGYPESREDTDVEGGFAESPIQENLPDAGPNDDVLDPNFPSDEIKIPSNIPDGFAGNAKIYQQPFDFIRERVSLKGECRPLEDAKDLPFLHLPLEEIGVIKEAPALRYLTGQALWDEKFKSVAKRIEKRRLAHLKEAEQNGQKQILKWTKHLAEKRDGHDDGKPFDEAAYIMNSDISWAWALQDEVPPPSAIAGRRDTSEAMALARMADRMTDEGMQLGALSLWTAMASFFSKADSDPKH